jgi:UDP-N-acetylmuramoylalanine--D-glutamate ligase
VTGSNGKSTTAGMIASVFNASGRRAFLGGNIGGSLLADLPRMTPDDWVVLEISSFQLWHFGGRTLYAPRVGPACTPHAPREASAHGVCRVHVAVVTACTPNHLDWHPTFQDYVTAKQRILTGQIPDDFAVLNPFDAEAASWRPLVRGHSVLISGADIPACRGAEADKNVCPTASLGVCPTVLLDDLPPLSVPGEHNRINAVCAAAAAIGAGCAADQVRRGLEAFRGLPQRLELIATIDGRRFYNDSTATTPESTIAALQALEVPAWLLAGGKSKGFDFAPLAVKIAGRACGAAFFGSTRFELIERVTAIDARFPCIEINTMQEALDWCWRRSRPGDAIVLSPACASTDQFRNFRQRGEQFDDMVRRLAH